MKKLTILLIAIIAIGCSKESSINFLNQDMIIDSGAQTVLMHTDISITNVFVRSFTGDDVTNISNELSDEGHTLKCKGRWFTATVALSSPKSVSLSVDANDTGMERWLEITVKHLCFQPSTIEITQKAE